VKTVFTAGIPGLLLGLMTCYAVAYFQGGPSRLKCVLVGVDTCVSPDYTFLERTLGMTVFIFSAHWFYRLGGGRLD
jgi:hypothetical protein